MEALPSEIKTRFNTRISHIDFASCHAYGVRRKEQTIAPGQENDDGRVGGERVGRGGRRRERSQWRMKRGRRLIWSLDVMGVGVKCGRK